MLIYTTYWLYKIYRCRNRKCANSNKVGEPLWIVYRYANRRFYWEVFKLRKDKRFVLFIKQFWPKWLQLRRSGQRTADNQDPCPSWRPTPIAYHVTLRMMRTYSYIYILRVILFTLKTKCFCINKLFFFFSLLV